MPFHDSSLKTIDIADSRNTLTTTWGSAIGDNFLSYYCCFCNIVWRAKFPRQLMVRPVENADQFPCPGCTKRILKEV